MIINSLLQKFYNIQHPAVELSNGDVRGSFFLLNSDGSLPAGLYEIDDDCDFAVGITKDGYKWSFDEEASQPVLVTDEKEKSEISATNETLAKVVRDSFISSNVTLTVDGVDFIYQSDAIESTVLKAYITGASDSDTQNFRLFDNSFRETSLLELKEIYSTMIEREKETWSAFESWCKTDKQTEFSL